MELIEKIYELCEKYNGEIEYEIEDAPITATFYYDMRGEFKNEMLITFSINSTMNEFIDELYKLYDKYNHTDNEFQYNENYGEESGCEKDRVWIWTDIERGE